MDLNLAEKLGEYASSLKYSDLGDEAVLETKKRIIDGLGCGIGAFNEQPVKIARRVVQEAGPATLLGTRRKSSLDLATFANGIMVRYFDYNDTYLSKEPAHPSDNISACLSVAEAEKSSGRDLLLAVALGYEIQCRLCDAADIRHRGWDHVCYGLVSSALAASKLMDLSMEKMTQAVNLALNGHIAMRQVRAGELSQWKGCSFANAARNAVFAARLAREGMTGPSPIFEGEMGFFKQVSGPFELDTHSFGGRRGSFKIQETYIKYFPAEYHSQSAIWAALAVRKRVGNVSLIESVEIDSHEAGYTILGKDPEKWKPATRETADHSLPYIVGRTLLDGKIDNSTYSQKKIRDDKVLAFLKKITVREDRGLTEMYPRSIANRVTAKLSTGETISEQVNDPRGHPKNPMSREEVEGKFRSLTKRFLTHGQIESTLDTVWNLEKRRDLSPLIRGLVIQ